MAIVKENRKSKYSTTKSTGPVTDLVLDITSLNLMCSFVISENRTIKKMQLRNMRDLFASLNMETYRHDAEKMLRIDFILKGLEAKLDMNLLNRDMVLMHVTGGINETPSFDISSLRELSTDEIEWINNTVGMALKYNYITTEADSLLDTITRFKTADYKTKAESVANMEQAIQDVHTKFRRINTNAKNTGYFSLRKDTFHDNFTDVYNKVTNPSNILKCGMQGLNEMLDGGFESTRTYLFFGLPGEGKSLMLLNLAYQLKMANKDYKTKDPTRIPCIIFLTMENLSDETIGRLYTMISGGMNLASTTLAQAEDVWIKQGKLEITESNPIDIIIKYVPDMSVNTNYLYDLSEELEDDGYEVICVIQDYIRKIRPMQYSGDTYQDLGSVVGDFKTFATLKDVPVITASQLNREAAKTVDAKRRVNQVDLVKNLGRDNISESMLILNNTDAAMLLAPEYDSKGNKFMGVQLAKKRYFNAYSTPRNFLYQPFEDNNGAKMVIDIDMPTPVCKDSMSDYIAPKGMLNIGNLRTSNYLNPNSIMDVNGEDENNTIEEPIYTNINYKANPGVFQNPNTVTQDDSNSTMDLVSVAMVNPIIFYDDTATEEHTDNLSDVVQVYANSLPEPIVGGYI